MIVFSSVQKKDIPILAEIYANAYNNEGDSRTKITSQNIIKYRYKKSVKIKIMYNKKIVGAFFSDVKPLYVWNVLSDGDVFIDPKYQRLWIGRQLFIYGIEYAIKKFHVVGWDFYTFKEGYQYQRYRHIGFNTSNKRIMMSGKIDDVLKKLKKK